MYLGGVGETKLPVSFCFSSMHASHNNLLCNLHNCIISFKGNVCFSILYINYFFHALGKRLGEMHPSRNGTYLIDLASLLLRHICLGFHAPCCFFFNFYFLR